MAIKNLFPEIKPTLNLDLANTKQLDPRITFTRATGATYYDGKTVAKAEENLAAGSTTFSAPWNTSTVAVTTGHVAPDGTTTAIKIAAKSNSAQHYMGISGSLPPSLTLSVYAKAVENTLLRIDGNSGAETVAFNLSTGVPTITGAGVTASMQDVGNGWWRCVIVQATARQSFMLWPDANQAPYAGNDINGLLVWGAQAENRSSVTAYTPTTSQPITNYLPAMMTAPAGVARFDHNPVTGESLGLLIEESRANLVLRSHEFGNESWEKSNITVSTDSTVAPDGTLAADKVAISSGAANGYARQSVAITGGTAYSMSVYAKDAGVGQCVLLTTDAEGSQGYVIYDLLAGGVVTTSGSVTGRIVSAGNGWYRCSMVFTPATTGSKLLRFAQPQITGTGNGFHGIYIWGAQLEAGSFATSYIPTTSAQVTRAADAASMTGTNFSSWYRQDEGTFCAESQHGASNNFPIVVGASDSSQSNNQIVLYTTSTQAAPSGETFFVRSGGVIQANINGGGIVANGTFFKTVGAYRVNDFAVSLNGVAAVTDTSGSIPVLDRLFIGASVNQGNYWLNGHIRKIAYYPKRLTNAQLQALTA